MKQYEILKKIGIIINELQEQYEFTDTNKEDLNDLELELFAANAHYLMEHLEILRKLNAKLIRPTPVVRTEPQTSFFEPIVNTKPVEISRPQPEQVEFDIPKRDISAEVSATPVDEVKEPVKEEPEEEPVIRHELIMDEADMTEEEEEQTEFNAEEEIIEEELITEEKFIPEPEPQTEEVDEPVAEAKPEPEPEVIAESEPEIIPEPEVIERRIVIENPVTDTPLLTINERISAQLSGSSRIGDHAELQPIKDLKSAINLNDKLLFVRDLFNGYSMAYSEAIEILNRFNRFEEADQFLKVNYYTKNNWEAKQATADKFYELLKRRFV